MREHPSIPLRGRRSLLRRALAALPLLGFLGRTHSALAAPPTVPFTTLPGTHPFTTFPFTTHPFTTIPFTTFPFTTFPVTTGPFTTPTGGPPSSVPEPASGILLGSGVAALAAGLYSRGIRDNVRRILERLTDTGSDSGGA